MRRVAWSNVPYRRLAFVAVIVVAAATLALISSHTALAAGSNPNSTVPPGSGPQAQVGSPFNPSSNQARSTIGLLILVGVESLIIFALVCAALFINITRFSHKPGQDEEPKQVFGNRRIEIAWTVIPAIILLIGFIATVIVLVDIQDVSAAENQKALHVRVTGHQWWWQFDIPSLHVHTSNALQLPDNREIIFDITSEDVIHSFWIPQLVVQVDATPNNTTVLKLTGQKDGIYPGACYEFCGQGHAWMQFRVEIDKPAAFRAWVSHQTKPFSFKPSTAADIGESVFTSRSCGACHTIVGLGSAANGKAAPNLTHVGSRWAIAGGVLTMSVPNLERWIKNPDVWKDGAKMPGFSNLTPTQLHDLAVFLYGLK